jgi:hypothetical protein
MSPHSFTTRVGDALWRKTENNLYEGNLLMTNYQFLITVKKRDDLEEPTNLEQAEEVVKWLLLNGSFIDVVKIKQVEQEKGNS